ncbi:MAG: hypothetical protein E8D42_14290 [Nitrospira sp.]|nr:MAG: hypothetical protein E8D42_14290 [Nitrospira sp.]
MQLTNHFDGYTKEQEKAIYQALKEAGLKADADWDRILFVISTTMVDLCEGASVPGAVAYVSTKKEQLDDFIAALGNVRQTYEELGERYQWHLDDQLGPPGHRLNLLEALDSALTAAQLAATKPNPHVHIQETGTARNHAMRLAVTSLLAIFEKTTGIKPTVYFNQHAADGYNGSCYKFIVACLAPVRLVARKQLGSNILSEYKKWNRAITASDLDKDKVTIVTMQSVEYREEKWTLRFDELEGCLPLDKSNFGAICGLYRGDLDEWMGQKIALCVDHSGSIQILAPIRKSTKSPPAA